ncbi:MAG: GDP-L-fucose synthase [Phycisphaerae bacterium]|nr:GDP-L-fucose synthase [Phycisphaerae bacterium]
MLDLTSGQRIVVTGGAGFLGRAVCAALGRAGVTADQIIVPRRSEFDLIEENAVERMYRQLKPTVVIHLAAEVGGIGANRENPGRFFYANMAMGLHLIEHARRNELAKFVQIGTVCSYPKFASVPFREDDLWSGYPEETNAPYGVAKKALLVMLQAYRTQYGLNGIFLQPVNLYGPGDHFDPASSHVIPAMIRKFVEARAGGAADVVLWGTGSASREFLFVDDCADGIVAALRRYDGPEPINLGTGEEITIQSLADRIRQIVGYEGGIAWDASKPDGQPRRRLDTSRAAQWLDWRSSTSLDDGLRRTIEWYLASIEAPA